MAIPSWNEFWSGLLSSLFGTTATTTETSTYKRRSVPASIDLTFPNTVNIALTRGLWNNSVPGYKLGAQLCRAPISVPLAFMGFPHFDCEDWDAVNDAEFWEEILNRYNDDYIQSKEQIQRMCHRDGTILIWPWYDSTAGKVRWKFIKPDQIDKVVMNPETDEIISISTSIDYQYYDEAGNIKYYSEVRIYSQKLVIVKRTGSVPASLKNEEIRRNPIGMLPVIFRNNWEQGEFEGHSDLDPIIPHIKAYSEINLKAHQEAANNRSKLIQSTKNSQAWLKRNGFTDPNDIDISTIDFVINEGDEEKTDLLSTDKIIDTPIKLMENDFFNIVEGSGIPEICWGLKTTGNHASAEEQMGVFLSFVAGKQRQASDPYMQLISATASLEALANNRQVPDNLIITWDDLDSLTEKERSEIFMNWGKTLAEMLDKKAIDLESAHGLLYKLTNGKITSDVDDFKKQIQDYGITVKAFLDQSYTEMTPYIKQNTGAAKNNKKPGRGEKTQRNGHKTPKDQPELFDNL